MTSTLYIGDVFRMSVGWMSKRQSRYNLVLPKELEERAKRYLEEKQKFRTMADLIRFALADFLEKEGY